MKYLAFITLLVFALAQPVAAQSFKPELHLGNKALLQKDYATALRHFRQLAEQGVASGQGSLGFMYDNGLGVTKDYKEAVRWYRKAANQGDTSAQSNLGLRYRDGEGVVQDLVMAYVWQAVSVANGKNAKWLVESRDEALAKLNAAERRQARKLSKLCFKKPASCPEYSDD